MEAAGIAILHVKITPPPQINKLEEGLWTVGFFAEKTIVPMLL
jgi:hypothetical protein